MCPTDHWSVIKFGIDFVSIQAQSSATSTMLNVVSSEVGIIKVLHLKLNL